MRDIATEAGYTPRTLYKHYTGKEELFHVLLTALMENKGSWLFPLMAREESALAGLAVYSIANYRYLESHPSELKLIHYSQTMEYHRDHIRAELLEEQNMRRIALYRHFEQYFKTGIAEGSLRNDIDIPMAQDLMTASYRQIAYLCIVLKDRPYVFYQSFCLHYLRSLCSEQSMETLPGLIDRIERGPILINPVPTAAL